MPRHRDIRRGVGQDRHVSPSQSGVVALHRPVGPDPRVLDFRRQWAPPGLDQQRRASHQRVSHSGDRQRRRQVPVGAGTAEASIHLRVHFQLDVMLAGRWDIIPELVLVQEHLTYSIVPQLSQA